METLAALVGQMLQSADVQAFLTSETLETSDDPDAETGDLRRSYLSSFAGGYLLQHKQGRIETLFLFILPSEGFEAFGGTLIGGLTSQSSRDEVRTRLGLPSHSKEAQTLPILGRKGAWDRYDSERICIHFEYTEPDERLRMVTVMAADTAPSPG